MPIIYLEKIDELDKLIKENQYLVLDFYADWCGPCKKIGELLGKLELDEKYKEVIFCKIDADNPDFQSLCEKYEVETLPKLVYYQNSNIIDSVSTSNENIIKNTLEFLLL